MRVVFDGQGLGGNHTGGAKALQCLLDHLRAGFPRHEYIVVSPRDVTHWRLPQQLWWDQARFLWGAVRQNAHVLHSTGLSAPILRDRPLVMTVHDLAPSRFPDLLPHWRSRWYWGRWIPFTAKFADAVIVPSQSTKRDFIELFKMPEAKIHVVPLAVPLSARASDETADAVRRRYRLEDPYLLYVGTIDRRKDYPTLLRALLQLDVRVSLVVAGTVIEGRTDFPRQVEQLGLKDRVRVLGYVPDESLPGLYRGAAAFVYPSFYEGFGLPPLEAMVCGTPVVTYNVTSLPEVVGDAGILLDPPWTAERLAEAIRRVLTDGELRSELRSRGFQQAQRFDWMETARHTVKVYEEVARKR
jgi:glycosyltransferase involved in cell wall biosynthesis